MKLLIIRHAQAKDFGSVASDGQRALTAKGRRQSAALGEYLLECGELPELVLTSPVLRAQQTAELLCEAAGIEAPLVEPFLSCGMRVEAALAELKAYRLLKSVAIVGHNPDLTCLVEHLLGSSEFDFRVKKASLTVFVSDRESGCYEFIEHREF